MGAPRRVVAFVRRLEEVIAEVVEGTDRCVLAYSGGLPSTLLAMIARKRSDLACLVAGVENSEDFRAAKAGKDFLDYRIEYVRLDGVDARRIRDHLAASYPKIGKSALRSLIPMRMVFERAVGGTLLAGFGSPRMDPGIVFALRGWGVRVPLAEVARGRALPRSILRDAACSLGLPDEWARVRHRAPAVGAGIEGFLRTS